MLYQQGRVTGCADRLGIASTLTLWLVAPMVRSHAPVVRPNDSVTLLAGWTVHGRILIADKERGHTLESVTSFTVGGARGNRTPESAVQGQRFTPSLSPLTLPYLIPSSGCLHSHKRGSAQCAYRPAPRAGASKCAGRPSEPPCCASRSHHPALRCRA